MELMNYIIDEILFSPIGFFLLIFVLIIFLGKKKQRSNISNNGNELNQPSRFSNQFENDEFVPEGTTIYQGNDFGIEWTSRTVLLKDVQTRAVTKYYTRWHSPAIKFNAGNYFLFMFMPDSKEFKFEDKKVSNNTFLEKLANKAGEFLLDVYVKMYFGKEELEVFDPEQSDLVEVEAKYKNKFRIFSNNREFAHKFMNWIPQIENEKRFDISFVVNANGITASTPTFLQTEAKIKEMTDFCLKITSEILNKNRAISE